jgi:hypothetical protein
MDAQTSKPRMELRHDPVPGFRPAFYLTLAAGLVYLALVFGGLIAGGGGGH